MQITIIYNEPLPSRYHNLGEDIAVSSVLESVESVQEVLLKEGHEVSVLGLVPPLTEAIAQLKRAKFDLLVNFFEGFNGSSETEWQLLEALTSLNYHFTGASAETIKLCLDKSTTKDVLTKHNIPTPRYQLVEKQDILSFSMPFPVILKPSREDASHGLSSSSVVYDDSSFHQQCSLLTQKYDSPILAEKFLVGREFNVAVIGDLPRVLPISEIVYTETMPDPKILTYAAKWLRESCDYKSSMPQCPASISPEMSSRIQKLALDVYNVVGKPSYIRVDLRCDEHENLYVLEVNPNPDLSPNAGLALQAKTAGISYANLVKMIVNISERGR